MFHIFTHVILIIFIYAKSSQWSSKICLVCLRKQNTMIDRAPESCGDTLDQSRDRPELSREVCHPVAPNCAECTKVSAIYGCQG